MYKFKLFLYNWSIGKTQDKSKLMVDRKVCSGAVHYKDREIFVDDGLGPVDLYKVVRHELTHAVLYETQLNLNVQYSEEDMCELMAKYGSFIVKLSEEIIENL